MGWLYLFAFVVVVSVAVYIVSWVFVSFSEERERRYWQQRLAQEDLVGLLKLRDEVPGYDVETRESLEALIGLKMKEIEELQDD